MSTTGGAFVVLTTIFPPTEAIRRIAKQQPDRVVVVGDQKTPREWAHPGVQYLAPDAQLANGWRTAELLPWNHYSRKIIGYLHAAAQGAEAIVDLDDDNIPHAEWGFPAF